MTDLEKVTDGLRACISIGENGVTHGDCRICPYAKVYECRLELERDALELLKEQKDMGKELTDAIELIHKKNARIIELTDLLKEQEPVKPEREHSGGGTTWWNVCGHCKTAINPNDKYCHECGRSVKWDG